MLNSTYWKGRTQQRMDDYHADAEDVINKTLEAFDTATKNIDGDINKIFRNYAGQAGMSNEQAQEMVNAKDTQTYVDKIKASLQGLPEEAEAVKKLTLAAASATAYKARITRLEAVKLSMQAEITNVAKVQHTAITKSLMDTIDSAYYKTIFDLQQKTGLGYNFARMDTQKVQEILKNRWSGKNYKETIWDNTETLAKEAEKTLMSGIMAGSSIKKMSDALHEHVEHEKYKSTRVIRTETTYVANSSELSAYKESGVKQIRFLAIEDKRTSSFCQKADGKLIDIDKAKCGLNIPPLHPNCRSTTIEVFDVPGLTELGKRIRDPETGRNRIVPSGMNYKDWRSIFVDKTKTFDEWKAKDDKKVAEKAAKDEEIIKAQEEIAAQIKAEKEAQQKLLDEEAAKKAQEVAEANKFKQMPPAEQIKALDAKSYTGIFAGSITPKDYENYSMQQLNSKKLYLKAKIKGAKTPEEAAKWQKLFDDFEDFKKSGQLYKKIIKENPGIGNIKAEPAGSPKKITESEPKTDAAKEPQKTSSNVASEATKAAEAKYKAAQEKEAQKAAAKAQKEAEAKAKAEGKYKQLQAKEAQKAALKAQKEAEAKAKAEAKYKAAQEKAAKKEEVKLDKATEKAHQGAIASTSMEATKIKAKVLFEPEDSLQKAEAAMKKMEPDIKVSEKLSISPSKYTELKANGQFDKLLKETQVALQKETILTSEYKVLKDQLEALKELEAKGKQYQSYSEAFDKAQAATDKVNQLKAKAAVATQAAIDAADKAQAQAQAAADAAAKAQGKITQAAVKKAKTESKQLKLDIADMEKETVYSKAYYKDLTIADYKKLEASGSVDKQVKYYTSVINDVTQTKEMKIIAQEAVDQLNKLKAKSEQHDHAEKQLAALEQIAAQDPKKAAKIAAKEAEIQDYEDKMQELNKNVYSGIWKDDVTPADFKFKDTANIQAKKNYMESKINSASSTAVEVQKFSQLLQELDDFVLKGKEYVLLHDQALKSKIELNKLKPTAAGDTYSQARKDAAKWYTYAERPKANDYYVQKTSDIWKNASHAEKTAAYMYTAGPGKFNRPLRGIQWGTDKFIGLGKVAINAEGSQHLIEAFQQIISKSKLDDDIWVNRGIANGGAAAFLGIKESELYKSQAELEQLLMGKNVHDYGFVSTSPAKGGGFSGVKFNIYCPKGTEALYVEPISAYGAERHEPKKSLWGMNWDGDLKQTKFGSEFEIVINAGYQYRITNVEKTSSGAIFIDMEIVGKAPTINYP